MRKRVAHVIAILTVMAAAIGSQPARTSTARAQAPSGGWCNRSGEASLSPGATFTPREISFTALESVGPCRMSDSSIQSGTNVATGHVIFSCAGGTGTGRFTIRWNNGRTTAGNLSFAGVGVVGGGPLSVTDGEFAGMHGTFVVVVTQADPSACSSSTGLTKFSFTGGFGWGGS